MESKHIAVITHMAAGHVYPSLDVCSALIRRGHRVTFPTNAQFAARVREIGAEALELEFPWIKYPDQVRPYHSFEDSKFWRVFASMSAPQYLMTSIAMVAALEGFYAANPPDVILYESYTFGGRILAKQLGRPAIRMSTHFANHDSIVRTDGVCTTPEPMLDFLGLLDTAMSTFGFEGEGQLWHVEGLNIYLIPRSFQYDGDSFDSRFKFVGATFSQRSNSVARKIRVDKGRTVLVISEASTSRDDGFLKLCIEALAESQYHVMFLKGSNSPEVSSTLLPRNFEIYRGAFNREFLPFAGVMLCQGGMGTTLESLYYGVPLVTMPAMPFNSEVAYRVAELGLGVHAPARGINPGVLRKAVDSAATDEALLGRVRQMQNDLRNNSGAESAADIVEEFLAC